MAAKSWKLVITELGTSRRLGEAQVEGENWLSALHSARRAVGESGGVPPGASCQVARDGTVTILDGRARQSYVLAPEPATALGTSSVASAEARARSIQAGGKGARPRRRHSSTIAFDAREFFGDVAKTAGTRVVGAPAGTGETVEKPSTREAPRASGGRPGASSRQAKKTIAYVEGIKLDAPVSAPAASSAGASRAAASSAGASRAAGAPRGGAPHAGAPRGGAPHAGAPHVGTEDAGALRRSPAPPADARSSADPTAPADGRRKPKTAPAWMTIAQRPESTSPERRDATLPIALVKKSKRAPSRRTLAFESSAFELLTQRSAPQLKLLHARTEEPTDQDPLRYEERVFVLEAKGQVEVEGRLEGLVRAQFEALKAELESKPPGKLLHLAVFDHAWQERPEREPLVALQWKDWRGEPEIMVAGGLDDRADAEAPAEAATTGRVPDSGSFDLSFAPDVIDASRPSHARSAPQASTPPGTGDDRLAEAFEAMQDLFFLTTPHEALAFVVRLLQDLVPCQAISASLYDINSDEFRFISLTGPGAEQRRGKAVPRRRGIVGQAAQRPGEVLLIEDVLDEQAYRAESDGREGLHPLTMATTALAHGGRLLGALQLLNREQQAQFSRADANLLVYVGDRLGEFLHRLHHHQGE